MATKKLSEMTQEDVNNITGVEGEQVEVEPVGNVDVPLINPVEKRRITVQGDINGYPVQIHFYDSDFDDIDETLPPLGFAQLAASIVTANGVMPRGMAGNGGSNPTPTKEGWKCPVHGVQRLQENKFNKTSHTVQCAMWSPTQEEWTKNKSAFVGGATRWYCSHQEPYGQ